MTPPFPYFGELCSFTTAIFWGIAVVLFKVSGLKMSPLALNLFKNSIGFVLLLFTFPLIGQAFWVEAAPADVLLIIVSGIVGIGISDTLFFRALNLLGASGMAIVDTLYSPSVIFFAFYFLGEKLSLLHAVGASLILSSILLPLFVRAKKSDISRANWIRGTFWGALAMLTVAWAIVVIKPILNSYPLVWITTVRMGSGMASLLFFALLHPERKSFFGAFRPQAAWRVALPASFIGAYACLLIWLAGFKYTHAGTASLLNQTTVVFMAVFGVLFLKEQFTWAKGLALGLAISGATLVIL
jgi:drug/metabolite transporter (DMT)-like permease